MATLDPIYDGGTVATPVITDNSTLTAIKGLTGVASSLLALRGVAVVGAKALAANLLTQNLRQHCRKHVA